VDDLARQRRMYEFLVRRAGGVAARLPQHLATVVLGLYDVRDLLGTADPVFTDHVTRYFTYCREHDVPMVSSCGGRKGWGRRRHTPMSCSA
jgi:4-hydroxyphenylacetate 3-monooxygenase